jgi:hypothetical protein
MALTIKNLAEKHQFSEQKVLEILKAAQIVNSKDTLEKVGDRQFSNEVIENGFNVIVDYLKTGVIKEGEFGKAAELFKEHQLQKEKIAKQAAVADAQDRVKSDTSTEQAAAEAEATSSITVSNGASTLTVPASARSFHDDENINSLLRREADTLSEDFDPSKALAQVTKGIVERRQEAEEYYHNYGRQLFDEAIAEKSQNKISIEEAEEIIAKTKKQYGL